MDYNKYFNNKLTIIYKRLGDQIKDAYLKNSKQTCENEISIIQEKFYLAQTAPEKFAYSLMGPGYTAQLDGYTIHIIKCQSVEVKINPDPEFCTLEIPIIYHKEPMFMSPTSHIIIKHARKTTCSKILPIKFKIDGKLIKFTPTLRIAKEPKKLDLNQ